MFPTRVFSNMNFANLILNRRKIHMTRIIRIAEGHINLARGARNTVVSIDNVTQDLKMASNPGQVLETISPHLPQFKSNHVMQTLKILFSLQKQGCDQNLLENENFSLLCKKLKQECRAMEINDTVEALKILIFMDVPGNSTIIQSLLQLVRSSVNELTLPQVIFLDFLLRKLKDTTPLVEALLIAFPLVFQLQIQKVVNHENVNELLDYLQFASKFPMPSNCIQSIVSALTLHGQDLPVNAAKSIVWSLCDMKHFERSYERLLVNSFSVLKKDIMDMSFSDVEITLSKIVNCFKHDNFNVYDEEFIDKAAHYYIVNKCNFTEAMWTLKKFNRMSYVNIPFLDYVGQLIEENPERLSAGRPSIFITVVNALSLADYKTKHWETIETAILQNDIFISGKDELPWTKCAAELASLDIFNHELLERIFSPTFLEKFLSREFNVIDHFQILQLYQAVKTLCPSYDGPFPSQDIIKHAIALQNTPIEVTSIRTALIYALENERYVTNGVHSKLGHYIDYVIVMRNGKPVPISSALDQDNVFIEDIVAPEDSTIICLLVCPNGCYATNCQRLRGTVKLRIRSLEALGYKVLPISISDWKNLGDREKIPYLLQKIKSQCENSVQETVA
ncbi:uncharacterized protein LOC113372888 [Ctenocephalides felis]|uniref:uncharacterized protein LOC113372888 n=1 Tax=Ctenocephalides felis TaxID=7515 RepID=UPI000E6E2846|nr:uncharacterized protein LOC113372888 [Ctenocephalides felis]